MRYILMAALTLWLGACAVGNTQDFATAVPEIQAQGNRSVAVAVQDRRPYVRSAEKGADFVGMMRGGFGNPWDITTESKRPMAADLTDAVMSALKKHGYQVTPVTVAPAQNAVQAQEAVSAAKRDRALLIAVDELKSDTYLNTKVDYDLKLSVYDSAGKLLADTAVTGSDAVGSAATHADIRKNVLPAVQRKLEALLNDPKVIAAMQ